MAHESQITGRISEITAAKALLANGWEVSDPVVGEVYDLVGRDPVNGQFSTFQVKTIRRRTDRNNEMVIYSSNGKGEPYSTDDVNYIVGVEDETAYMFENDGKKEYWRTDASASKRWVNLTFTDDRESDLVGV